MSHAMVTHRESGALELAVSGVDWWSLRNGQWSLGGIWKRDVFSKFHKSQGAVETLKGGVAVEKKGGIDRVVC